MYEYEHCDYVVPFGIPMVRWTDFKSFSRREVPYEHDWTSDVNFLEHVASSD